MNYKDINGKKHELRENSILTIKEYYGYELKNPHTTMVKRRLNIVNNSFAGGVIFAYFVVNILHI